MNQQPPAPALEDDPPAPEAAVLDAAALGVLTGLDPSGANRLLLRVMGTYRESQARLLAQLVRAHSDSDTVAAHLAVHTLKSSSSNIGALALAELCGAAEKAMREGRENELPELIDRLRAEAARVDIAVAQLIAQTK